jgi:hypothetical protein
MAKKARKKSAAKSRKKSKAKKVATKKLVASKQTKTRVVAKKKKKKAAAKAKPRTLGGRLANAYHTVVDTVTGTDRLRNKLEPPGTSETE